MSDFSARLSHIRHVLSSSAVQPLPQVIAVSKQQTDERIDKALAAGYRVFGENRVQEAQERWTMRRHRHTDLQLHLIGPLQSNKSAEAVALFDIIHTIDREKIALSVDSDMKRQGKTLPCFIQVNTGEEPQKAGIEPSRLADFIAFCRAETALNLTGLMCIPPVGAPPALHFLLLRKLAQRYGLSHLSMGMSNDYPLAARCGATHVRIGSTLFGER